MGLKNHRSESTGSLDKIQKVLAQNGANKIMFDYKKDGTLEAITFMIETEANKPMGFRLPALVENVAKIMYGDRELTEGQAQQAYRTAWANIRDWIDAQLALVATKQVKIQHVFLPYLIMRGGRTLAETIDADPKFLLGDGK